MNDELEVLKEVTQCLNNAKIPYMITGSIAMNYYAFPRMTRDIDIVIELQEKDITNAVNLFKDNFYIDRDSVTQAVHNRGIFNIIHNEFIIKVDFIIRKSDEYRQIEFQRRLQINIDSIPIWIVSLEDLIISKLWWAKESQSHIQISDVKNLLGATHTIDHTYINKWLEKMNLQDVYRKVINA